MHAYTPSKYLIVVVGPTAVGKTACCMRLAKHLGTEIISADARQCYQGMAIGTAQPTPEMIREVPHHLVNYLPVHVPYHAEKFAQDALQVLNTLLKQHDYVIMTGGSGLYIQAVCEGLDAMPSASPTIRAMLNQRLRETGLHGLVAELAIRDPAYHRVADLANPRRVIRALEVCLATAKPYSTFRKRKITARPFNIIKIGLTRARASLYQGIDQRVKAMVGQGLIQEAEALYPQRHYNALQTIGYREIFGYLDGHYSQEEAIRLLKRNTRRYAKRQKTWFERDTSIRWFHPDETSNILRHIESLTETPQNKPEDQRPAGS